MTPVTVSPPPLKFLVIDYSYTCLVLSISFVATTDVPCHLYLHLSNETPIIRKIPYRRRGVDVNVASVTCFVEVNVIEQDQAGDTLTHTFTVPLVEYCHFIYFYLTGTQASVPMTSISQIFSLHCAGPDVPVPLCGTYDPYIYGSVLYCCRQMATPFYPTSDLTVTSVDIALGRHTSSAYCRLVKVSFWTSDNEGKPLTMIYGEYDAVVPILAYNQKIFLNVPLPDLSFSKNTHYAFSWRTYDKWCRPFNIKSICIGHTTNPVSCPLPNPAAWYYWAKQWKESCSAYCYNPPATFGKVYQTISLNFQLYGFS